MIKCSLIFTLLFFVSFSKAQTVTDAQGKKQGYWKKYDPKTGKLLYEGLFKDDKPQGIFKYYNINDSVKAKMTFVKEGKVAYATLYHLNGKKMGVGKYIEEQKDSIWNYYDEKGTLISQENFIKGNKEGKSYVYFPDGVVSEVYNYKNNLKDGAFKQYFNKTSVRGEGNYIKGEMDGKNAYYYPNGETAAVGYYKNGYKTGPWIYKDSKGKITEKEWYKEKGDLASPKETEELFAKSKENALNNAKIPEKEKTQTTKKKGGAKK